MKQLLTERRKELDLTQAEVAKRSGIARQTYSMIETGERNPSVPVGKKIAEVLGFDWTLFFEDKSHEMQI